MTDSPSIERRLAAAATAFAAIWAFSNAQVLRLANSTWVSAGGTCFAFGVALYWIQIAIVDATKGTWHTWLIPLVLLLSGGGIMTWQEFVAQSRISATAGQCRALELEMLAVPKMREADAAAFTALQCSYSLHTGDTLKLGS